MLLKDHKLIKYINKILNAILTEKGFGVRIQKIK